MARAVTQLVEDACIDPLPKTVLAQQAAAAENAVEGEDVGEVLDAYAALFSQAARQHPPHSGILLGVGELVGSVLGARSNVGGMVPAPTIADLRLWISDRAWAPAFKAELMAILATTDPSMEGERAGTLMPAILAAAAVDPSLLRPADVAGIVEMATAVATAFKPEPVVREFKDGVRRGDHDAALAAVVPARQPAMRAIIDELSVEERGRIDEMLTLDLVLRVSRGPYRQFTMLRDEPGGLKGYPMVFAVDCDGSWKLAGF